MIAIDQLRSPCCGSSLAAPVPGGLACDACAAPYPVGVFGPDLMPPDADRRFLAYPQWQAVQQALTAWRQRTWDGSKAAAARTDDTVALADRFIQWAGIHGEVLDVGCGGGWLRGRMGAVTYHGLDPMPMSQAYPFPFVRGIADRLPFPNEAFDTVCFFSSIDYAIDIHATLGEARRVLKTGGRLAVATPIQATKQVNGERLHHYRFLAGELDELVASTFDEAERLEYQRDYHFLRARKGKVA